MLQTMSLPVLIKNPYIFTKNLYKLVCANNAWFYGCLVNRWCRYFSLKSRFCWMTEYRMPEFLTDEKKLKYFHENLEFSGIIQIII